MPTPMFDNLLVGGPSGDFIRTVTKSGVKTQVVSLDIGAGTSESLVSGSLPTQLYAWNPNTLSTVALTVDAGGNLKTVGGGGGGGAVTVADGADVAEGSTADAAYVSGSGTVVAVLKGIFGKLS